MLIERGAVVGDIRISARAASFTESVIREMTRLATEHGAINLAQGFPDFAAPPELKNAAARAIEEDFNQYPITWGAANFRAAIADKYSRFYGMQVDPERQVCVTCGATEAMIASLLGVIDPGDEIVVFEPFYENYGPDAILAGAVPRYVMLHEPDWAIDEKELARAFSNRTRGVIINTPNNPTGKVFSSEELDAIARLCQRYGAVAFTDEIYEHIVYESAQHVPIATLPGMEDRTVTISALSKSYAVTGWRVGWAIASAELVDGIRTVHDFLTVGAPTPLQEAGVTAVGLPDYYYRTLVREYAERRELMLQILAEAGLKASSPAGAYYVLADISGLGLDGDVAASDYLVKRVGVAAVPGSSFYSRPERGANRLRFSFSKRLETLHDVRQRMARLAARR
jgi:aspartate/methionine/tyrosine aminotransferase